MLTPIFSLTQDESTVTITIKAQFVQVSETEIFYEDDEFRFFSKPYFLRLTLPGEVQSSENGSDSVKYNHDTGEFVIILQKKHIGHHFDGLDMLTKLLTPKGKTRADKPLIEFVDDDDKDCDEDDGEWYVDQHVPTEDSAKTDIQSVKYGFANQRSQVISALQEELTDLFDVKDVDCKKTDEIRSERLEQELQLFNGEHYLADTFDNDEIDEFLSFEPSWRQDVGIMADEATSSDDVTKLTIDERDQLIKLPKRNYLLGGLETQTVVCGLIDILCCYCYNVRTTLGENTVESGWTVRKLSSTLSWLDTSAPLKECLITFIRRSLCFPLYRNWYLSMKVIADCIQIIGLGKTQVLKCLLDVRTTFNSSESYYVLNDLYITDYCIWIQSLKSKNLKALHKTLKTITFQKDDVGFGLLQLENSAMNGNDVSFLDQKLSCLSLNATGNADCDATDSDDSSSTGDCDSDDENDDGVCIADSRNDDNSAALTPNKNSD